jgi:pimeloyl-ACP methyl ester carboxylesterase
MAPGACTFDSAGVRIAYDDVADGPPLLLLHGFASNRVTNWRRPGWYETLTEAGRRVIALDFRGHGESEKPHDPSAYGHSVMAEDVVRLLDHRSIETADVMGYSMGGAVTIHLVAEHGDRVNAAIIGGVGSGVTEGLAGTDRIADALEAADIDDVQTDLGRRFRRFADGSDNDLRALAAVMRARAAPIDAERWAQVATPALTVAGSEDDLVDAPQALADRFPHSTAVTVDGTDHLTTVGAPTYKEAVLEFLDREGR